MRLPFVVVEAGPAALEDACGELVSRGWAVHSSRLAGGPGTVWATTVADSVATSEAVLAAVAGFGLLVDAVAERDVLDLLCDDLRRLGVLDHRVRVTAELLGADEHALLRLLSGGATLGDAATRLHLSRRSADRRLAAARRALGAESTTAALATYRRRIERLPAPDGAHR
jgi:hypothetical protein